jgi:hypothetical protein
MKSSFNGGASQGGASASGNKMHGIFIGKIKDNRDPEGLGRLRVWIPQLSSANEENETSWYTVRYCPPMAGATNTQEESLAKDSTKYSQTNQSYGMWMVPPNRNVNVLCSFINGELHQGVWWACLPHDGHTHALPAIASGSTHDGQVAPLAERNRYNTSDPDYDRRPEHPMNDVIKRLGLEKDLRRGHINASPFRNKDKHPGAAYGFLSPGQHHIVIDDGEEFKDGQIRLRTASGNTIIMDNDEGFIYFITASGKSWMQLDKEGNVDVYAAGDFSVNAEGSINLRAGNNINMDAGNNINAAAAKNFELEACEVFNATGTTGMKLSTNQNMNILADSQFKMTGQRIDLNGTPAERAKIPTPNSLVTNKQVGKSIAGRVPEAEPWGGHTSVGGEQPTVTPNTPPVEPDKIDPAEESYKDAKPAEEGDAPVVADAVTCIPDVTQNKLSEEGFALLMSREAYRGIMYSDYQGYSAGYGCRVDIWGPDNPASKIDANLKQALVAGPSEAEARMISRQIIDRHVTPPIIAAINAEKAGKNVCITQAHIDALIIAAYMNPTEGSKMAKALVQSGLNSADGRPQNADIASIWANSRYSNSAQQRNTEAHFAMTGAPNGDTTIIPAEKLMASGIRADKDAVAYNKARNPKSAWLGFKTWNGKYGNGPKTGTKLDTGYGKPTAQQLGQWERSYFLNTGEVPLGCNLTLAQLRDKYGMPHLAGNFPPATKTA